jgi:hypothetical protein
MTACRLPAQADTPVGKKLARNTARHSSLPFETGHMSSPQTIKLNDCLWLRGQFMDSQAGAAGERRSLGKLGVRLEILKGRNDHPGLARLRQTIWNTDDHVVLSRLAPLELKALYPIFKDRGNFSVVLCDWWSAPCWFTQNAEYRLYNFFNFLAVRSGWATFARFREAPLLQKPDNNNWYTWTMQALRLANLAACPVTESLNAWQRRKERLDLKRMIYFPLAIEKEDVPLREEEVKYDFSSLGSTNGLWLMRDPFAPSYFTGANLYSDRRYLVDQIMVGDGDPYRIYSVGREKRFPPWQEYCQIARQSRFTFSTGGLHEAAVPKFIEFTCLGTPMVGRPLPFEFPWLDQCLFPLDPATVNRHNIRAKLNEALSQYPKLRENCLNLREKLLRLYSFENLLQMAQDQIDGKPVPDGYLTSAARRGISERQD